MAGKAERRAARSVIAGYHDQQLSKLVNHIGDAVDRYRAGEQFHIILYQCITYE